MTRSLLMCGFFNLKPGTGKTTSALFLATALALAGWRTLLADADPGRSALSWNDRAARAGRRMPFDVIGIGRDAGRQIVTVTKTGEYDAVVVDVPQIEDHAGIARDVLTITSDWIMPIAPSPIELDRSGGVTAMMNQARRPDARRWALLNRTNTVKHTPDGPDTQTRDVLTELGFTVFHAQIRTNDNLYRQVFGTVPPVASTPFPRMVSELLSAQPGHSIGAIPGPGMLRLVNG